MQKINRQTKTYATVGLAGAAIAGILLMLGGLRAPMPDFRQFEAGPERKEAFFSYMRPIIDAQNAEIRETRERLIALDEANDIGWFDRRWLKTLASDYDVELTEEDGLERPADELVDALLLRVDEVPMSLALAQAAKESGWGTSRFAREGNNFYGEWCFRKGCGIVPRGRGAGKAHEVAAFSSPTESVASYMHNINTHSGYRSFRRARKQQRDTERDLSGVQLAEQLSQYSERRDAYVSELKQLIVVNGLDDLEREETGNAADGAPASGS
jgi:Bax protein